MPRETQLQGLESRSWTVWLCPDCGLPTITPNATEVYGVDRTCPGFEAATDQVHADAEPVEYVPRSVADALAEALATIAVDISKHESDSEGLVWRVKLAHETDMAYRAAYPKPEEAER